MVFEHIIDLIERFEEVNLELTSCLDSKWRVDIGNFDEWLQRITINFDATLENHNIAQWVTLDVFLLPCKHLGSIKRGLLVCCHHHVAV